MLNFMFLFVAFCWRNINGRFMGIFCLSQSGPLPDLNCIRHNSGHLEFDKFLHEKVVM